MKQTTGLLLGIVLLLIPQVIRAQGVGPSSGDEHIDDIEVAIAVNTDGTIKVAERISYDFGESPRHGIYRDIPFVKTNDSGKKFAIDFSDISVTDAYGKAYQFTQSRQGDDIRLKIGDPDKTITGKHIYNISYQVSGALTYFPGHDELYWNAVGNRWPVAVTAASVRLMLPKDVPPDELRATCFTGPAGSTESDCTVRIADGRTVIVTATQPLASFTGLTVVVGFPKGIVGKLEPRELVPFFNTLAGQVTLVLLGIVAFLWYILAPVMVVRKWWISGRDPKPGIGEASVWFGPPKNHNHRELTPAECGTLIDERADLRDIYASIVDLARRGYLNIVETKKNTLDLVKAKDYVGDNDLLPFERELLNGTFTDSNRVSIKTLDLTKTLEKVKSMLYETLVTDKFFPRNPQTLRGWYIALTVLSLIFFNPILFLVSLIFGRHMPRKTLFGAEAAAMARSLCNFLTSQDKKLAFQAKHQLLFEKLLPYAVAFGVEEIWARRFANLGLNQPEWYRSSTGSKFNGVVFAQSLSRGLSVSFAASITSHSSRGFSSGFSGGSSGGGGGGGGGGSW